MTVALRFRPSSSQLGKLVTGVQSLYLSDGQSSALVPLRGVELLTDGLQSVQGALDVADLRC